MSNIARHALLPSLLASALVSPAVAEAPRAGEAQRGSCAAPSTNKGCPSCALRSNHQTTPARDLLDDGEALTATRKAVRSILAVGLDEAEEAAQEAGLRAVARDLRACCERGLQRWMFRTAKNYLLDRRRKKSEVLLSNLVNPRADDDRPMALPATSDIGPLQILELRDEVDSALTRNDISSMSADKKVQLGRALGDRLQAELTVRRYLPKAAVLVDQAQQAVRELSPQG